MVIDGRASRSRRCTAPTAAMPTAELRVALKDGGDGHGGAADKLDLARTT